MDFLCLFLYKLDMFPLRWKWAERTARVIMPLWKRMKRRWIRWWSILLLIVNGDCEGVQADNDHKKTIQTILLDKNKKNANTRCLMTNKNTRLRRWRRSQGAWKRPWGWFKDVQSLSDPSLAPGSSYVSISVFIWIKFIIGLWCYITTLPWNLGLELVISVPDAFQFKLPFSFFIPLFLQLLAVSSKTLDPSTWV